MALTHSTLLRNYLTDLISAAIGNGGHLVFETFVGATVASLPLSNPAFAPASAGLALSNPIGDDTNAAGGLVAIATLRTAGGVPLLYCSVTTENGGGDIELESLAVFAGQTVSVSSLTYEAPP